MKFSEQQVSICAGALMEALMLKSKIGVTLEADKAFMHLVAIVMFATGLTQGKTETLCEEALDELTYDDCHTIDKLMPIAAMLLEQPA